MVRRQTLHCLLRVTRLSSSYVQKYPLTTSILRRGAGATICSRNNFFSIPLRFKIYLKIVAFFGYSSPLSFGLPKTLELVDQFFISFHWVGAVNVYQQEDKPIRASIQQLGVFTFNTTSSNLQVVSSPLQRFRIWTGFIHTRVAAADIAS